MSVTEGVAGPLESSVYANAREQAETLPTASVAVARRLVVWSLATVMVMPGEENWAAVPLASGGPEQSEVE